MSEIFIRCKVYNNFFINLKKKLNFFKTNQKQIINEQIKQTVTSVASDSFYPFSIAINSDLNSK
jgi:hypothetical protein